MAFYFFTAFLKRSIHIFISSGLVFNAGLLTTSLDEISTIVSTSLRPLALRVEPVDTRSAIWRASPSDGAIPAKNLDDVIGKTAQVDIFKDQQILWIEIE